MRNLPLFGLVLAIGLMIPNPLDAWGAKAHMKITSDAYFIMPAAFQKFLGAELAKPAKHPALPKLMTGAVEPDRVLKDFHNHVFHIHGYKLGNGPFRIETLVKEVIEDIKTKKPRAVILQKLGWISHYTADLAQPLHTGVATWEGIEEKSFHAATEKDADRNIYTYGVYYDGAKAVQRLSPRMVYEALWANQYYAALERAYTQGNKYQESKGIISRCYSRAVNNVVDMWYSAWVQAGGAVNPKIDSKPKFFPPYDKKNASTALPRPRPSVISGTAKPATKPTTKPAIKPTIGQATSAESPAPAETPTETPFESSASSGLPESESPPEEDDDDLDYLDIILKGLEHTNP